MGDAKTLLLDISSLERQLQDIITQRELMGINHKELEQQQETLQTELISKKKALRSLAEPGSHVDRRQRALINGGVSLQILEEIAGMEDRLCAGLPVSGVLPLDSVILATMEGPTEIGDVYSVGDHMCASAMSTYPRVLGTDSRQGDPICDRYKAHLHSNGAIMALADGCNWGRLPYEAAVRATETFVSFLAQHVSHITSMRGAGPFLLAALTRAHNSITEGREIWDSGTTTLIGGLLLPLSGTSEGRWGFVCVSLGDCKAFHYSQRTRTFVDITRGNRRNLTDAKDPGGRLGPYIDVGQPDLRNLHLYYQSTEPGDLIFLVSDGVHDNLDPQQLGTTPGEADIANTVTWEEAEKVSPKAVEAFKDGFRMKWLQGAFNKEKETGQHHDNTENSTSKSDGNGANVSPQQIVDVLLRHAVDITRSSRDFMEQYPQKRLPQDFKTYPGKMDHVSCVCVRVGVTPKDPSGPLTVIVTAHLSADKIVDSKPENSENISKDEQVADFGLETTVQP
jgi:hypothetical protein